MDQKIEDIRLLGNYLAQRDISVLTSAALSQRIGSGQADLLILLGGSIPYGCQQAAQAMRDGLAKQLMVVGGIGHTTPCLRKLLHEKYPSILVEGRPEADIIIDYFALEYGMNPREILRENRSSNCGENASFALRAAREAGIRPQSVLLMQDSTMQRRIGATFQKEWAEENPLFLNYAAYLPNPREENGRLLLEPLWGMWEGERFLTLIMGEIPRLRDDAEGYGPKGKGFIVHVEIPPEVLAAFERLRAAYESLIRRPWSPV